MSSDDTLVSFSPATTACSPLAQKTIPAAAPSLISPSATLASPLSLRKLSSVKLSSITTFKPRMTNSQSSFQHSTSSSSQNSNVASSSRMHTTTSTVNKEYPIIPNTVLGPHSSHSAIEAYLTSKVRMLQSMCVIHMVLQLERSDSHTTMQECPLSIRGQSSHYEAYFRRGLFTDDELRACWSCWCPMPFAAYQHNANKASKCNNEFHCDFWRGTAYLVWRCSPLRERIFHFLQISPERFSDLEFYKTWLLKTGPIRTSTAISNMTMIVYAYLRLKDDGLLPSGELMLDGMYCIFFEYILIF